MFGRKLMFLQAEHEGKVNCPFAFPAQYGEACADFCGLSLIRKAQLIGFYAIRQEIYCNVIM
jgi:hypothetical protein